MPIHKKISGNWTEVTKYHRKVAGVWYDDIRKVWLKNQSEWKSLFARVLPEGLIIPYTAGAGGAPDGWSLFSAADGKYIVGAGDTYAVGANGGTGAVAKTSNTTGNHAPSTGAFCSESSSAGNNTVGNHSHNVTFTYQPPRQNCYLIKSDIGQTEFPAGGVIWQALQHASLTNIWTEAKMFRALASLSTGGTDAITGRSSTSQANHNHGSGAGGNVSIDNSGAKAATTGGHSHSSITMNMTNTLRRYALAAYQDAASAFNFETNMIAMFENTSPPLGWFLCDGNNGTPDLRNYFVKNVAYGDADVASGNGTVTAAGTLIISANHNHNGGQAKGYGGTTQKRHTANYKMAAHSISTNYTWLPDYYALAFIMKG
jgi:hypothetical protein